MNDTDPKTQLTLEGPFNRFVGAAIDDGLFFAAAGFILGYLPASVYKDHPEVVGIVLAALAGLWLLYFAFCEARWGRTVGKMVMGMRVVNEDGSKIGVGRALLRNVVRLLDYLLIGPILIASTGRRQRLGDLLGGTIVISERPPTRPAPPDSESPAEQQAEEDTPLTERQHVKLAEPSSPPAAPPPPPPATSASRSGPGYASVWRRSGAFSIDALILLVFASVASIPAESLYEEQPELAALIFLAIASLAFNYFVFAEWKWKGQTIGKRLVGIRVLADDGEPLSFGAASMRNLLRLVDFFFLAIGPILILGSAKRQRLGDQVAHTVVVRGDWAPGKPEPEPKPPVEERREGERGRLPEVGWGLGQTIRGVVGGLLLAALVAPLLVLPFDPDLSSLGATLVAQALLTLALVGTALYVGRARDAEGSFDLRETLSQLGWRRFHRGALGQLLATMFIYYIVVALYASIVIEPNQDDIGSQLGLDRGILLASIAVFLICIVAPIAEETFFRGFVFAGLRQRLSRFPAALISGLIFGAVHAPTGLTAVVPLTVFGIALALLYERTGSLWPSIIAHMINNSLALAVAS